MVLGLRRLFSPRVLIAFPPPDFIFHKGVGPFWKINVEEDADELKVRTHFNERMTLEITERGRKRARDIRATQGGREVSRWHDVHQAVHTACISQLPPLAIRTPQKSFRHILPELLTVELISTPTQ